MKKTWFYRLLLSYLPFFVMTFLIFAVTIVFFLFFGKLFREDAQQANEAFVQQIMQTVDYSLKTIDKSVMQEIQTNDKLNQFFMRNQDPNPYYTAYEVSQTIRSMMVYNHLIDSIYVYRPGTDVVLTQSRIYPIGEFGERKFLDEIDKPNYPFSWVYRSGQEESFLSLVRKIPLFSGDYGVIVVNVAPSSIRTMIEGLTSSKASYIALTDAKGLSIFGIGKADNPIQLSQVRSGYTGWEIRSGIKNGTMIQVIRTFLYLLTGISLLIVVVGGIWTLYSVRRNYRPIETIISHIKDFKGNAMPVAHEQDEFKFIEASIGKLKEQSSKFQRLHEEDLTFRRSHFFKEIISGRYPLSADRWKEEAEKLGLDDRYEKLQFAVVEIDNYAHFTESYSNQDQYLLKFVMTSLVNETAESEPMTAWCEWIDHRRLGVLFQLFEGVADTNLDGMYESIRSWTQHNMHFTVTIGRGLFVDDVNAVHRSYSAAIDCLNYKIVLGCNRLIREFDLPAQREDEFYKYMGSVRTLSQCYRMGDERWIQEFDYLFTELQASWSTRQDVLSVIHYLINQMTKDMNELPSDLQDIWEERALSQTDELLNRFETLSDIRSSLGSVFSRVSEAMSAVRERRSHHQLAREIREYIERNYANPDMSLSILSERFQLSTNQLSRIFKDEFGEKFVDFLARVRIDNAKDLLLSSPDSINLIANKVGYNHTLSFIRVFKKVMALTPGEFRSSTVGRDSFAEDGGGKLTL